MHSEAKKMRYNVENAEEDLNIDSEVAERLDQVQELSKLEYIKFSFNKENIQNSLKKVQTEIENYSKNKTKIQTHFYGELHTLISKNIDIVLSDIVHPSHQQLISTIARLLIEAEIMDASPAERPSLYHLCKQNITNKNFLSMFNAVVNSIDIDSVIVKTGDMLNNWYSAVMDSPNLNTDNYLRYMQQEISEKIFYRPEFGKRLYCALTNIRLKLNNSSKKVKDKSQPQDIKNLFKKRESGDYNIDYILGLLVDNKNNIEEFFKKMIETIDNPEAENNIQLIMTAHKNWEELNKLFKSFYDLTYKEIDQLNEKYLIGRLDFNGVRVKPLALNNEIYNKIVDELLEKTLPVYVGSSKKINAYLTDKISAFKILVKSEESRPPSRQSIVRRSISRLSAIFGIVGLVGISTIFTMDSRLNFSSQSI